MLPEEIEIHLSRWLSGMIGYDRIAAVNSLQRFIHQYSPFSAEPVDCIQWIPAEYITVNDYNPNSMSPVEKKLLERSLLQDGFTQPVVVTGGRSEGQYLIVDGCHRFLLSQKNKLSKRFLGHIPVTCIRTGQEDLAWLMAATVRHNRARGQHRVVAMSDIVRDLARLGWSDDRIGKELGMEQDEVLRLKQISGLTELFATNDYSESWTVR